MRNLLGKIEHSLDLVQTSKEADAKEAYCFPVIAGRGSKDEARGSRDSGRSFGPLRNTAVTHFTNERDGALCRAKASTLSLARG